MREEMSSTLRIYKWPSQALWRYFELQALKRISYERPILEIGCGDGRFSALVFNEIDEAIDVNPRSVEKCRKTAGHLYRKVRCQDARELEFKDGGYGTVYANCVMEHIPDLEGVLAGCHRGLCPGGKLVMTVPLTEMNKHLLLPWRWYARMRQRQLVHVNLLTEAQWGDLLRKIGFSHIEFRPYLTASTCQFWDKLDSPGNIGLGRYRIAPIFGALTSRLLPRSAKAQVIDALSDWLYPKAKNSEREEPACAVLVIAQKPAPAPAK